MLLFVLKKILDLFEVARLFLSLSSDGVTPILLQGSPVKTLYCRCIISSSPTLFEGKLLTPHFVPEGISSALRDFIVLVFFFFLIILKFFI